jgi:MinD-like ATPase involved in chromosome partitioning or flagellar assembly
MSRTMLITIVGPAGKADVAAPADTPVEELLPTFLELSGAEADGGAWEVGVPGRPPLPGGRTLADAGVADGSVLHLRRLDELEPVAPVATEEAPRETGGASPSERTRAVLPEQVGGWGRFTEAVRAAARRPEPAPGAATRRTADPKALVKEVPSTPTQRARAAWRASDYDRRLDDAVRAPRLRRCATIAVVSPKGGVGKTTVTALLGGLYALLRRDRTVAVDTNPDYGSLGRALAPEHEVFVDDLLDILEHPDLTATRLDSSLGRGFDGLMVLPAPTDPARMARLDRAAYAKVIDRLQTMAGLLVLDCGTGLQEPAAQAAIMAADQLVLVSDAEPSTASLVAEASELLERAGAPITLVVNKVPRSGGRLDLGALEGQIPHAQGLVTLREEPARASRVAAGEFTWTEDPGSWARSVRELAAVLVADWPRLGLTDSVR